MPIKTSLSKGNSDKKSSIFKKQNHFRLNNTHDDFDGIYQETVDFFNSNGIRINDIQTLLHENDVFERFVDKLTANISDPAARNDIVLLMENARGEMLQENTVSQLAPISNTTFGMIRKLWSRFCLNQAIPSYVTNTPDFAYTIQRPFMIDKSGNKYYLPNALLNDSDLMSMPKLFNDYIPINTLVNFNILNKTIVDGEPCSVTKRHSIDKKIFVEKVIMEVPGPSSTTVEKEVVVNHRMDIKNNFTVEVKTESMDPANPGIVSDILFAHINLRDGLINGTSLSGKIKKVKFRGHVTQESNSPGTHSFSFETEQRNVMIGTGTHFNAPVPIEFLKDNMALYNIDATVELMNIISYALAMDLDKRCDNFISESFVTNNLEGTFTGVFNLRPVLGSAVTPTEWRKEIRTIIDWWCNKIKSVTYMTEGYFVLYGNTMDISVLPEVQWTLSQGDSNVSGVSVNYNYGVMTGTNAIKVVASDIIESGYYRMIFVPTSTDQMSYAYFPYSFNVETNTYQDANMPYVPNLMVTKRDTHEEVLPLQARIILQGNDGTMPQQYA